MEEVVLILVFYLKNEFEKAEFETRIFKIRGFANTVFVWIFVTDGDSELIRMIQIQNTIVYVYDKCKQNASVQYDTLELWSSKVHYTIKHNILKYLK